MLHSTVINQITNRPLGGALQLIRLDTGRHFFTKRVVKHWNRLPAEVVDTPSVSVFRRHLDNAFDNTV